MVELTNIALPEILLWLLTYAVVYGILQQVNIPKSKAARTIIAIVAGFMVLFSYPEEIILSFSKMAADMLLVIIGLLVFLITIEMSGVKLGGKKIQEHEHASKIIVIAICLIAIAIFISAGGLRILGWEGSFLNIPWETVFFLVLIIAVIWWMASEEKEEKP